MNTLELVSLLREHELKPSECGQGWQALCPAHDDHNPSLSIKEAPNGRILLHCHAGCDFNAIVAALDVSAKDLAPAGPCASWKPERARIVAEYPYRDENGKLIFEVIRIEPGPNGEKKTFRQRRPPLPTDDPKDIKGDGWVYKCGSCRVLYRLPEIIEAVKAGRTVFLTEGEKDADALVRTGLEASCNPGGAHKWRPEFNNVLADADVVIIADKDENGRLHAGSVAIALYKFAKAVRVIELPDIHGKRVKDAADFLAAGGTTEEIVELAANSPLSIKRPFVELPGDNRTISDFASELAVHLRTAEVFNYNGLVNGLNFRRDAMEQIKPDTFRSLVEGYLQCFKKNSVEGRSDQVTHTMSKDTAAAVLASPQFRDRLPEVHRVAAFRFPVKRDDGSLQLLPPGYDVKSKTYTLAHMDYPTDMAIDEARKVIADLFSEFRFHGGDGSEEEQEAERRRSRAVAVSALFALYCQGLLPPGTVRPGFLALANDSMAGKTTLWSLPLLLVAGHARLRSQPNDDDEMRKSLLAVIIDGSSYLFLDNLRGHLASPSLEGFMTASEWGDRILGESRSVHGRNNLTVFLTGNNLTIEPDVATRFLVANLVQDLDRPEERTFKRNIDAATAAELRPRVMAACWAILRDWHNAGRPAPSRSVPRFSTWAGVIAAAVEYAGFGSPLLPPQNIVGGDEQAEDIRELVAWLAGRAEWTEFSTIIEECGQQHWLGVEPDDVGSTASDKSRKAVRRKVGGALSRSVGKRFAVGETTYTLKRRRRGSNKRAEYRCAAFSIDSHQGGNDPEADVTCLIDYGAGTADTGHEGHLSPTTPETPVLPLIKGAEIACDLSKNDDLPGSPHSPDTISPPQLPEHKLVEADSFDTEDLSRDSGNDDPYDPCDAYEPSDNDPVDDSVDRGKDDPHDPYEPPDKPQSDTT